jgi:excisionase family DNA binding protein
VSEALALDQREFAEGEYLWPEEAPTASSAALPIRQIGAGRGDHRLGCTAIDHHPNEVREEILAAEELKNISYISLAQCLGDASRTTSFFNLNSAQPFSTRHHVSNRCTESVAPVFSWRLFSRAKHIHIRPHPFPLVMRCNRMQTRVTDDSREPARSASPLAVSVKTACELVGVGNTTMWGLIKAGRVKTVSIGRRRLVIFATLESLLTPDGGNAL